VFQKLYWYEFRLGLPAEATRKTQESQIVRMIIGMTRPSKAQHKEYTDEAKEHHLPLVRQGRA
jgi:hypothetical protein